MSPVNNSFGNNAAKSISMGNAGTWILVSLSIFFLLVSAGKFVNASSSSSSETSDDQTCSNPTDGNGGVCSGAPISTSGKILNESSENTVSVNFHPDDRRLLLYHFETTTSTQDEAKILAEALSTTGGGGTNENVVKTFCVTTTEQTSGRGTSGRQWLGAPGNVFVTIGVRQSTWTSRLPNVPLTLLPLKVGELTAQTIQGLLDECRGASEHVNSNDYHSYTHEQEPFVTVKWPNDVLCDHKKISGTLIESAAGWFLIGIGINVMYAPIVPTSGADHGRPSVSIRDYCSNLRDESDEIKTMARKVGEQLAYDLHTWFHEDVVSPSDASNEIVNGWKEWLDWDMELVMRDTPGREKVRMVDVLPDGRVQVENLDDGATRVLVSDYFL
jgi:biotin-(acetyl-CoA carboxylase) ligase